MALQVRRGTNTERLDYTPLQGELIYDTTTKQLYVGDGATAGGVISVLGSGSLNEVVDDTTPQLGGDLDINTHDITGTGNINITGSITATSFVGDGSGLTGVGSSSGPFIGDLTGSVFSDNSTLLVDAQNNIFYGNLEGNVIGNTTGIHTGDVNGSIFADNSTLIVDGINNTLRGESVIGNLNDINFITATRITTLATAPSEYALRVQASFDSANTTDSFGMLISRSRGTLASPSALVVGDPFGDIIWNDFANNASGARILGRVDPDGTVAAGISPGRLEFHTAGNTGVMIPRGWFESAGTFVTLGIHNGRTTAPTGIPFYSLSNSNVTSDGPRLLMRRSRGTFDAPLTVVNGDALHRITFGAHDGTSYLDTAFITARVDGTVSTAVVPTSIDIKTTNSAGTVGTNATFRTDKHTQFSGAVKLAVYADDTARDAAVTAPEAGMMIFNTTLTKFQGYTGSAWVDLN